MASVCWGGLALSVLLGGPLGCSSKRPPGAAVCETCKSAANPARARATFSTCPERSEPEAGTNTWFSVRFEEPLEQPLPALALQLECGHEAVAGEIRVDGAHLGFVPDQALPADQDCSAALADGIRTESGASVPRTELAFHTAQGAGLSYAFDISQVDAAIVARDGSELVLSIDPRSSFLRSYDAGKTFGASLVVPTPPDITLDSAINLHFRGGVADMAWRAYVAGVGQGVLYLRAVDDFGAFGPATWFPVPSLEQDSLRPNEMATATDGAEQVWVTWSLMCEADDPNYPCFPESLEKEGIYVAHSADGGRSFEEPRHLGSLLRSPRIAWVGGSLMLAYLDEQRNIVLSDGSDDFAPIQKILPNIGPIWLEKLTETPTDGVYLTWRDGPAAVDLQDIWLARLDGRDPGNAQPWRLYTEDNSVGRTCFALAAGDHGELALVVGAQANSGTVKRRLRVSKDFGATFAAPQLLDFMLPRPEPTSGDMFSGAEDAPCPLVAISPDDAVELSWTHSLASSTIEVERQGMFARGLPNEPCSF